MQEGRVDIITMGCSKNLIDSERLIKRIDSKGYSSRHNDVDPSGEYVVVNTCGFIGDAKEESINMILNLIELKNQGKIGKIAVMGCLSERYLDELKREMPEVDFWYGKFDWSAFIDALPARGDVSAQAKPKEWERSLTTGPWTAYVKISEGCDRFCAFCAIPLITGRHKSRPKEEILEEVASLAAEGVKEFNIIAQDLSSYGLDIYGEGQLPQLVEAIAKLEGVEWIRLHYLYPTDFPLPLLDVMAKHDNICRYLDLPLQHISDMVLKGMNRKTTKEDTLRLIRTIREKVPGIHLRTTLMTGFPGETDKEFDELLEFVKAEKFDRLGGFAYCEEEDTLAQKTLKDVIPQKVKEERLEKIMDLQQEISLGLNREKIGKRLKVLVEEENGEYSIGRSEFDSPEVDQEVIIYDCSTPPGEFTWVEVTDATPYELQGNEIKSKSDKK